MSAESSFDQLRTKAFRGILVRAFKVLPRRLDEILRVDGWSTFVDFMAAVDRTGRVFLPYAEPRAAAWERAGREAMVEEARKRANTDAMLRLLAAAFVNRPGEEPDTEAVLEALEPYGIQSWYDFAMTVQEIALALYARDTGGRSPLDAAKIPTLHFYSLKIDDAHAVAQVIEAFGLSTERHLEALLHTFYAGELTIEDLDRSVGRPEILTGIVNRLPSNPFKGIVFGTPPPQELPTAPVLGEAGLTYAEELVAQGLPALRTREERIEAFKRWGSPNRICREGTDILALLRRDDPDCASVYVDDDQDGRWMAVLITSR